MSRHSAFTQRRYCPVNPDSVEILRNPPTTQYMVIGTIRVSWFGIRTDEEILRDIEIQNALRREAARLGADAVISIVLVPRPGQRPGELIREIFADHLVATAIRTAARPSGQSAARSHGQPRIVTLQAAELLGRSQHRVFHSKRD